MFTLYVQRFLAIWSNKIARDTMLNFFYDIFQNIVEGMIGISSIMYSTLLVNSFPIRIASGLVGILFIMFVIKQSLKIPTSYRNLKQIIKEQGL